MLIRQMSVKDWSNAFRETPDVPFATTKVRGGQEVIFINGHLTFNLLN